MADDLTLWVPKISSDSHKISVWNKSPFATRRAANEDKKYA